jgi:hypothetical protein
MVPVVGLRVGAGVSYGSVLRVLLCMAGRRVDAVLVEGDPVDRERPFKLVPASRAGRSTGAVVKVNGVDVRSTGRFVQEWFQPVRDYEKLAIEVLVRRR